MEPDPEIKKAHETLIDYCYNRVVAKMDAEGLEFNEALRVVIQEMVLEA